MRKKLAMLQISLLLTFVFLLASGVSVLANEQQNAVSEALRGIGVTIDAGTDSRLRGFATEMPRLAAYSTDSPIKISSESDVEILLSAVGLIMDMSDYSIHIDAEIITALENAGLRDIWRQGIWELTKYEREHQLRELAQSYTMDELYDMGLSRIFGELRALGLLEEYVESQTVADEYNVTSYRINATNFEPHNFQWRIVASRSGATTGVLSQHGPHWRSFNAVLGGEEVDYNINALSRSTTSWGFSPMLQHHSGQSSQMLRTYTLNPLTSERVSGTIINRFPAGMASAHFVSVRPFGGNAEFNVSYTVWARFPIW